MSTSLRLLPTQYLQRNYDDSKRSLSAQKTHYQNLPAVPLYCYQLGILPKDTTYHPASPQLRADLRHLDDIDRQTRYLASHKIETVEELLADRSEKEAQLESLVDQRTKLQNKIRRASPEQKILLRKEKAEVTAQITALRKDIRDSKEIEQRSLEIQDTLDRAFEAEHTDRNRKEHAYLHENR